MEILYILFADVNVLNGALIVIRFSFESPTFECAMISLSLMVSNSKFGFQLSYSPMQKYKVQTVVQ